MRIVIALLTAFSQTTARASTTKDFASLIVLDDASESSQISFSASSDGFRIRGHARDNVLFSAETTSKNEKVLFSNTPGSESIVLQKNGAKQISEFIFRKKLNSAEHYLVSVSVKPRVPLYFTDNDMLGGDVESSAISKHVNDQQEEPDERDPCKPTDRLTEGLTSGEKAAIALNVKSEQKIDASCGTMASHWIRNVLSEVGKSVKSESRSYLSCLPDNYRKNLRTSMLEQGKPTMNISCSSQVRSKTEPWTEKIELGRDALGPSVSKRTREKILMHELLHLTGIDQHDAIDAVLKCCGEQRSDNKACAKAETFFAAEAAFRERRRENTGVYNVTRSATVAANAIAEYDLGSFDEQPSSKAQTQVVAKSNLSSKSVESSPALPQTVNVRVGAADNLERVKPTLTKYRTASRAVTAAGNTFQRIASNIVPSARASTGASTRNGDGSVTYEADSKGQFELTSGEKAEFILPFNPETGFGTASLRKVPAEVPSRVAKSASSVYKAPPTSASLGTTSGESGASSEGSATAVVANSRSLSKAAFKSSEAGSVEATSAPVAGSGSSLSASGGPSGGHSAPVRRGQASVAPESAPEASATLQPRKFQNWNQARETLTTSKDPETILAAQWFKPYFYGRQIWFRGKAYGPKGQLWNLDAHWKPTE